MKRPFWMEAMLCETLVHGMTSIFHHDHTMTWYDSSFPNMSVNLGNANLQFFYATEVILHLISGKTDSNIFAFILIAAA